MIIGPAENQAKAAIPLVFAGCFGWLHLPRNGVASAWGVVLCSPFGAATVNTHRNWRVLAECLAEAGFPTLRFDYPSTGDSSEADGTLPPVWCGSIQAAVSVLREQLGVKQVVLCGLQLGALLAAKVAALGSGEVTALALLMPPLTGNDLVRELYMSSAVTIPSKDGLFEAKGLCLAADDLRDLRALSLIEALRGSAVKEVLVLEAPWQNGVTKTLSSTINAFCTEVNFIGFPFDGLRDFLLPSHLASPPSVAFLRIIHWLTQKAKSSTATIHLPYLPVATLKLPDGAEHAVHFGTDNGLFGILTKPNFSVKNRPAVLIVNTGANHRIGNSRFAVLLARRLAALGITSFRIDVTGLGDSSRPTIEPMLDTLDLRSQSQLRVYRDEFCTDVTDAIDELVLLGYERCIVVGVCSGANLALYAAERDQRVVGVAVANITFYLRYGRESAKRTRVSRVIFLARSPLRYLWRMAGRAPQVTRIMVNMGSTAKRLAMRLRSPTTNSPPSRIHSLVARGVDVLLIFSDGDKALADWNAHLEAPEVASIYKELPQPVIIKGNNHTFDLISMRDELISMIEQRLSLPIMEETPSAKSVPAANVRFDPPIAVVDA